MRTSDIGGSEKLKNAEIGNSGGKYNDSRRSEKIIDEESLK